MRTNKCNQEAIVTSIKTFFCLARPSRAVVYAKLVIAGVCSYCAIQLCKYSEICRTRVIKLIRPCYYVLKSNGLVNLEITIAQCIIDQGY